MKRLFLLLSALVLPTVLWAAPHLHPHSAKALDLQLAATLQSLSSGNLPEARMLARQAARSFPSSALAQLLAAELSASAAHRQVLAADAGELNPRLQDLLLEARARLHDRPAPVTNTSEESLPDEVVQLGQGVSALLVVDLADSSLHHLAVSNGRSTLIQQHYIGSGKAGYGKWVEGDNKTPLGVYRIDGYRSDASLPDLYGAGALTLDYPNALDRFLGRTGSGIWVHGVPHGQRSRSPRSSEGCVTMSNDHFTTLHERLTGEPSALPLHSSDRPFSPKGESVVLLTHDIHWRGASARILEQQEFQTLFERYQQAWHRRNVSELLSLYASADMARENLRQVTSHKRAGALLLDSVNKRDISIFYNPSSPEHKRSSTVALSTGSSIALPNSVTGKTDSSHSALPLYVRAAGTHLVMQMQMGERREHQLTLYWERKLSGQWQLVTEQWRTISS